MESSSGSKLVSNIRETFNRGKSGKSKTNKWDTWIGFATLLGIVVLVTALAQRGEDNQDTRQRAGFHCLSSWDGSYRALVDLVTENLRDPSSFEHVETRISNIDAQGQFEMIMKYRANNGFGGKNVELADAVFRDSDCKIVSWFVGE